MKIYATKKEMLEEIDSRIKACQEARKPVSDLITIRALIEMWAVKAEQMN